MRSTVVGREREMAVLDRWVEGAGQGLAVMAIEGGAGIGKTTLWQEGVRRARHAGFRTLVARAAAPEVGLSFGGLGDLFDRIDRDQFDRLPVPQQEALATVLLQAPAPAYGVEQRALGAAVLSLLRNLAAEGPVLVAVDDVPWLDPGSADILSFAIRRLEREPVGVLVTERSEPPVGFHRAADTARIESIRVGPMGTTALHELIKERTGTVLPRPTVVRIAEACEGNPFHALEVAAQLAGHRSEGGRLPAPPSLSELIASRLSRLPEDARDALVTCAMVHRPTADLVDVAALEAAERAGIVEIARDRIRFCHPLFAEAVYERVEGSERRHRHRRLAGLVDDPEERARHLALASAHPDAALAEELERAGTLAGRRGAPQAAAELIELAMALTPAGHPDALAGRRLEAARFWAETGDLARAERLLEEVIADGPGGDQRARALALVAQLHFRRQSFGEALESVRRARREAREPDLQAQLDLDIAFFSASVGDLPGMLAHARAAGAALTEDAEPGTVAEVLAVSAMSGFLSGAGFDEGQLKRSLDLEDLHSQTPWQMRPSFIAGCIRLYCAQTQEAVRILDSLLTFAVERGKESEIPLHCLYLTWALVWKGELERAREVAELAGQTAALVGDPASVGAALTAGALVHALDGSELLGQDEGRRAVQIFLELGWPMGALFPSWAVGLACTAGGQPEAVEAALRPLAEMTAAIGDIDPGLTMFIPDHVEALVELGRAEEAEPFLRWFEDRGRAHDRALVLATSGRCRALVQAAGGDLASARAGLEGALVQLDRIDVPFERARTLLALGKVLRRSGQRAEARRVLEDAAGTFGTLGMTTWAARVREETGRLGGRRAVGEELTSTEHLIAGLAATGLSNRQIAERTFLTTKTVEANLTRAYRKLGIRSRGGLAQALGFATAAENERRPVIP